MFAQILLCALAAAGVLTLAWCLGGRLLLPCEDTLTLYPAKNGAGRLEKAARCHEWLTKTGLLAGRFVIVDYGLDEDGKRIADTLCGESESVLVCTPEELPTILKMEL
jgi:hypothetical protein